MLVSGAYLLASNDIKEFELSKHFSQKACRGNRIEKTVIKATFILTSGHVARGWIFSISDKSFFSSLFLEVSGGQSWEPYTSHRLMYSPRCFCPSNRSKVIHGSGSIVKHNPIGEPNTSHLSTPETFDSSCTQKDNQQYFRGTTTLA